MITRRRLAAAALVLTSAALLAHQGAAAKPNVVGLSITHPWSRPAAAGGVGVGYFTILNTGRADRLLRVETSAADHAGLHVSLEVNGVMTMDEIKTGVRIDPAGRVDFRPGGLHLMFVGLKKTQKLGDSLPATLVFEKAGRVPVVFKVESGAPSKPMGGMTDMPGMKH